MKFVTSFCGLVSQSKMMPLKLWMALMRESIHGLRSISYWVRSRFTSSFENYSQKIIIWIFRPFRNFKHSSCIGFGRWLHTSDICTKRCTQNTTIGRLHAHCLCAKRKSRCFHYKLFEFGLTSCSACRVYTR